MRYKAAVFDMDGTILNTIEDLTDSTNYALSFNGLPERSLEEVRCFVGNGIRKLIERAVPEGTSAGVINKVFETFTDYYKGHSAIKTRPYEGINQAIVRLRAAGVKTAVVSNKADFGVQDLCRDYFPGMFDFALGEKSGMAKKPAPDMVEEALRSLGIDKKDAVYIGDSDVDIMTAKNSGLDVIMVGWGFRDEEFILEHGAPFVIHSTEELVNMILGE